MPVIKKSSDEILSLIDEAVLPVEAENPRWLSFFLAMRSGLLNQSIKGWHDIGGAPILPHGSQGVWLGQASKPKEYMIGCVDAFNYNAEHTTYITSFGYDNNVRRIAMLSDARLKALHDIMLGNVVDIESKSVLALIENELVSVENGELSVLFPVLTENEMLSVEKH